MEPETISSQEIDARKATHLVREYFQEIHGNWMLMFKIENAKNENINDHYNNFGASCIDVLFLCRA